MVFVAEYFLLLALLARCLSPSKGVRREAPAGDRVHLSAQRAGHASTEGLLLAGCLVTEGEGVETGKALDLLHFISTAGAGEAEVSGLQGNFRSSRGGEYLGHFEAHATPYMEWVETGRYTAYICQGILSVHICMLNIKGQAKRTPRRHVHVQIHDSL